MPTMLQTALQSVRKDVIPRITYQEVSIKDVSCKCAQKGNHLIVEKVIINGEQFLPSKRFWVSMMSRFGISDSVFKYFTYKEVFDRISDVAKNDLIRVAIQQTGSAHTVGWKPTVLAVTNPNKPILYAERASSLIDELNGNVFAYHEGVAMSEHRTKLPFSFKVGDDKFDSFIVFTTPIDGYGSPSIALGVFRVICSNGNIALHRTFQSGINIGKKEIAADVIRRVVSSYSNEDGFVALKQRMESSQKSWASVYELLLVAKTIRKLRDGAFIRGKDNLHRRNAIQALYKKGGNPHQRYGTVQLESLGAKRLRLLPTACHVYDLFNLITEMATHQLTAESARGMWALYGEMIANEYDLENSATKYGSFEDFVQPKLGKGERMLTL